MQTELLTSSGLSILIQQQVKKNDAYQLLQAVFQLLRSGSKNQVHSRLIGLIRTLAAQPQLTAEVSALLCRWLCEMRIYPLLISNGILSREGLGGEMSKRLYEKISPAYKDPNDLRDIFFMLFCEDNDEQWTAQIKRKDWQNLIGLIMQHTNAADAERVYQHLRSEGLYAVEMLSIWIAAEELEPELMRLDPRLLDTDSPFVALQREVAQWLSAQYKNENFDDRHLQVMFIQCREQLSRLEKKGVTMGSSLRAAYLLERLGQTLDRLSELLLIFSRRRLPLGRILGLTKSMAISAIEQHSISILWKQSVKMLARSITKNTGDHGEHYITRTAGEYTAMFFSAAGGGVLIALMALLKIYLGTQIDDKVWKGLAEGLNYGLGFTLIYMLHFTVATKQPAMTAARFAEAVERNPQGRAVDMKLAQLLIDVWRSQSVAVAGNVIVAIGVASAIACAYAHYFTVPLLNAAETAYQLDSIDPTKGTLWFASIAGLWLFCAGIISGYFENRSNYLNARMRLRQHPLLVKLMKQKVRERFADYIHDNFGSIMGNLCFGMLLGITGVIGYLTGLPLDIRHVAFSSANLGYVMVSADLSWQIFWQSLSFVLLIGIVNLIVSFSLTLWLALRSLNAEIDSWSNIAKCVWQIIKKRPLSLFLPLQLEH